MKNIILVGLMGAGKSTVGRRLSQKIGWEFVDTDSLVEKNCGTSVNVIFEVEGEKGFRLREKKVIEMVMNRDQQIIATGGGAPTLEKNRKYLSKGFVIYLYVKPQSLWARLQHDDSRPLLQGSTDVRKKLEVLFEERDPIYRNLADFVVSGENLTLRALTSKIVNVLRVERYI